ncbi:ABC transporter permease [Hymenobacter sp. BT559]|uniref:ABC transporter permease subunit n=1 Tax=Hymenobacter sp. BT559 TaxID=2795729 RepID=UPI0018ECA146|nr:ABC transporter permease [Hymenobacter sp. BT559]MBJ6143354.1 ABC transporter permease [Hymenobacter sp. BT559]
MRLLGRWLAAQVGRAFLAAWAIASLVFLLSRLDAAKATDLLLGETDNLGTAVLRADADTIQHQARQAIEQRLGLAEPLFYTTRTQQAGTVSWHWHGLHNQYHRWLVGLLHGHLGLSFRDGQPIGPRWRAALAYTIPLTFLALLGAIVGALLVGLVLADGPQAALSGWRAGLHTLLTGLQGLPLFALALGLLFAFANPDMLNILPAYAGSPDDEELWGQRALRLVLPVLALVLAVLPELALLLAHTLRHELSTGYATTARAKGLSNGKLLRRHALPNAILPLLTALAGLLPALVAGAVVVETIFALPGTGRLLAEAVAMHDYPVVVAGVLFTALARLLALALADALYAWADPRIRLVP